jgi:hypothetical protein
MPSDVVTSSNISLTLYDGDSLTPPPNCDLYFRTNLYRKARTTDAITLVYSFSVDPVAGGLSFPESIIRVQAEWMARRSDGAAGAYFNKVAVFRVTGGASIQIGATQDIAPSIADAAASTWATGINTASSLMRVEMTGEAATTIDWLVLIDIRHMWNIT